MSKNQHHNQTTTGVTKTRPQQLTTNVLDFSADAGAGLEGADKNSFALPFIAILQGLSPQMETVPNAKIGLFINTITNALSTAVDVVPVAFQRRYLEWAPRDQGGGFKGSHNVASVESDTTNVRNEEGQLMTKGGNLLKDTRIHYVLAVNADGSFTPAIVSMSSTQIKKSMRWLSLIQSVQMKDAAGKTFNPPSFSHIYRLTSVKESNDSGTWYGFDINAVDPDPIPITDAALYAAAKALNAQVIAGTAQVSAPPKTDTAAPDKF